MQKFNKLVRDKIDSIINNNGKGERAVVRILDDAEYEKSLILKIDEEVKELKEAIVAKDKKAIIEESADLLEVVRAINGGTLKLVQDKMEQKRETRGGFDEKKFLIGVESENEK